MGIIDKLRAKSQERRQKRLDRIAQDPGRAAAESVKLQQAELQARDHGSNPPRH